MAVRYQIHAIPTAILVDRDGNVVSFAARGDELKELLAKQFPETGDDVSEPTEQPEANAE